MSCDGKKVRVESIFSFTLLKVLSKPYVSFSFCSTLKRSLHWNSEGKRRGISFTCELLQDSCINSLPLLPTSSPRSISIAFPLHTWLWAVQGWWILVPSTWSWVILYKRGSLNTLKKSSHLCSENTRQVFILEIGFVLCFACSHKHFALASSSTLDADKA